MSDTKSGYSSEAHNYMQSELNQSVIEKSKTREGRYNKNWEKQSVNINEVVEKFAPDASGRVVNGKFIYFGENYNVIADLPSGYLRIYSKQKREYVTLEGKTGTDEETHYKIKRREEM